MDFFVWPGAMFFCKGGLGSLALPPLKKSKQRRQTEKDRHLYAMDFCVWPGAMFFCKGGLGSLALPPLKKSKQRRQTEKDRHL